MEHIISVLFVIKFRELPIINKNPRKLHKLVPFPPMPEQALRASASSGFNVRDKGSKKACRGQALWPFLIQSNSSSPQHLYEGQGTAHWKVVAPRLRPLSLSLSLPSPPWPWDIAPTSCILLDQYSVILQTPPYPTRRTLDPRSQ